MMREALAHPLRFHRDHRFTRAQASDYLDGELTAAERRRIDDHTHVCPRCARFVAGLRRTVTGLRELRSDGAPGVSDGVLARLRAERSAVPDEPSGPEPS